MDPYFLITILALGIIFIWTSAITFFIFKITAKNKELFSGNKTKGQDIYSLINGYLLKMRKISQENQTIIDEFKKLQENYAGCVQKVALIRYNPFKDIGGDQSFSLALLDKKDNGVVLTSILSREGNRAYAKNISKGKSEHKLSLEEEKAIDLAIKLREGRKEGNVR